MFCHFFLHSYIQCIFFYFKFSDGHKRTLSVSDEATEPAKKPKIEEDTKLEQDIKVEFNNSIKKTLKKLSREVCSILDYLHWKLFKRGKIRKRMMYLSKILRDSETRGLGKFSS